jgi:small subunit ribosomal protein S20
MANKKAAKKYILVTKRNNERNTKFKSLMKTEIKKAIVAIENKDKNASEIVKTTLKQIDKTSSKGIIHKNSAARKKSNLTKKLNSISK